MTLYYAMPSDITKECKMFDLEVKLEKQDKGTISGLTSRMPVHNQSDDSYSFQSDVTQCQLSNQSDSSYSFHSNIHGCH